jgi:hypothetical protein
VEIWVIAFIGHLIGMVNEHGSVGAYSIIDLPSYVVVRYCVIITRLLLRAGLDNQNGILEGY